MCSLSLIEAIEQLKQQSGNFPRGGGIWTASRSSEGDLNKNFQKIQMPGGLPGGGECWSFDLTGT